MPPYHHRCRRPLAFLAAVLCCAAVPADAVAAAPTPRGTEVVFCDPLRDEGFPPPRAAKKLRLEPGAYVRATAAPSAGTAAGSRERYLLLATAAVEGGFDAVNVYDRGILSWGLMQWTAHADGLQNALWYAKQRLIAKRKARLWAALFKAQGLDVQRGVDGRVAFFVGGPTRSWRPVRGQDDLRVLFRGTKKPGKYDPVTVARWARVFARAGRNPTVQTLQTEWATRRLRACLDETVDRSWRVGDFSRGDLFSDALTFALWTNNPEACREHYRRAVRACRKVTGSADPARWPPGLFPLVWEHTARTSTFGTWARRAETVAALVPVGRVGRGRARAELAARGWSLKDLPRGRGGAGQLWRRGDPSPPGLAAPKPRPVPKRPARKV
jgi:hypothetical protein